MASDRIGTLVKVPWEDGMAVGGGYDIYDLQTTRSPFEKFDLEDASSGPDRGTLATFGTEYHTIETTDDLQRAIYLSAGISASMFSLGNVKNTSQFFGKVKCNANNMATVIRCTYTLPAERYDRDYPPELTEEASNVLDEGTQQDFFSRYGQYFIAGRIRQSSFYACYTHSAQTKAILDDFKNKVTCSRGSEMTGLVGIEAVAKYNEITNFSEVHTESQIYMTGVSDQFGSQVSQTSAVESLRRFTDNYKPLPDVAILEHYAIALPAVSRPRKFQTIGSDLWDAYEQVLIAEIRARSHSMLEAQKMARDISRLLNEISKIHLADPAWKTNLGSCKERLREKQGELDRCDSRLAFLKRMRQSPSCDAWPRTPLNSVGKKAWTAGLEVDAFGPFASEVRRHMKEFRKEETSSLTAAVQVEHVRHEYSDRIIVSARVTGYRHDAWLGLGLNGNWRLIEGGIGQSYLEVEFTTSHWRSGGYSLEVWTVPWALYAEGQV